MLFIGRKNSCQFSFWESSGFVAWPWEPTEEGGEKVRGSQKGKQPTHTSSSKPNQGGPTLCFLSAPHDWALSAATKAAALLIRRTRSLLSVKPRCSCQELPSSLSHEEGELLYCFSLTSDTFEKVWWMWIFGWKVRWMGVTVRRYIYMHL